ncbi:MAG: DUF11 domain-containing protein [Chloroflexota bacterium]|nr:DUF11 domain-containing protein [Chloroflexota bacterium]
MSKRLALPLVVSVLVGILVVAGTAFASPELQTASSGADLAIANTDSPDPVAAGAQLTYTLKVTNRGPDVATVVTVTDTLPTSVSLASVTFSQGSCTVTGTTVACNIGDLAKDASAVVTVVVVPSASGTVANTATVSGTTTDPDATNNTAAVSTTVNPVADVSIAKTDSPDPVVLGNNVTYSLTASNRGPSAATGVVVTDNLPATATFVSSTPSQGSCTQSNGILTCNLGTLAKDASATVIVAVTPTKAGTLHNTARVAAAEYDPAPANNAATSETRVDQQPGVDLAIDKSDSPDSVLVGGTLTYTIRVINKGQLTATGVVVTDDLPAGLTLVSATASQGSCTQSGTTVTCNLGSLSKDASATITVVVTPTAAGTIRNVVKVSANEADQNPENNTAAEKTQVVTTQGETPGKITFTGIVQALPEGGTIGAWTIQGIKVNVTKDTKLDGTPEIGSLVKVEGTVDGKGAVEAKLIEVKKLEAQAGKDERPGYGYGDTNHKHAGPPGLKDKADNPKAAGVAKPQGTSPPGKGQAKGHQGKDN